MGATLEQTVRDFFTRLLELRPVEATYVGIHDHDHRLPDGSLSDAEAEIELLEGFSRDLESADGDPIDLEVARYFAALSLYQNREIRLWESMAEAPEQIGTGIFLIFGRDHAPLPERLETIAARLADVPRYLECSKERLRRPVALWNRVALEQAQQLPGLIDVVTAAASEPARRRLEIAGAQAREALADYCRWLRDEVIPGADSREAVGERHFHELLRLRRLPDGPDRILELGRRYLEEAKEQRVELVASRWPGRELADVEAEIRSDHRPDFEGALEEYRQTIAQAREFVSSHGIATIPPDERLDVIETPSFARPVIPFAAYEPAPYFDERQLGIYIVTPPSVDRELEEHNRASILNTSVHEAYPGHHLQFVCANRNPSVSRLLGSFHAHEFIEGWAHYCEQLMYEDGFSHQPEVRFIQLTDQIWRACRIVIDVELSSGRMDFEAAVAMLTGEAGMARAQAEAEVKRYTYNPGYQLSYLYGKHLLLDLRDRIRKERGAAFDQRQFHDRLLYAGALPASLWNRLF